MDPATYNNLVQMFTHGAMFLLLVLATKPFWGKILDLLDARRDRIQGEFDRAEELQKKFENLHAEYDEKFRAIEETAREKMNEEVAKGNAMRQEILSQARKEAEELRAKSERDIQQQINKARVELKEEIVGLTLMATQKLLDEELNDDKHRKLVGSFIEKVDAA